MVVRLCAANVAHYILVYFYKINVQGSLLTTGLKYTVIIVSEVTVICRSRKHTCMFTVLKSYRTH